MTGSSSLWSGERGMVLVTCLGAYFLSMAMIYQSPGCGIRGSSGGTDWLAVLLSKTVTSLLLDFLLFLLKLLCPNINPHQHSIIHFSQQFAAEVAGQFEGMGFNDEGVLNDGQ